MPLSPLVVQGWRFTTHVIQILFASHLFLSYGYELGPWTLEDGSGNAQNLTAASLVLNVQDSQDPSGALLFTGSISIDNATEGLVHYTVANGNFPRPGVFLAQIGTEAAGDGMAAHPRQDPRFDGQYGDGRSRSR